MASVSFTVTHHFDETAQAVWDELIDWAGHANWIPATRVEVAAGDPHVPGAEFTAWTGVGPLALKDHMRVESLEWDPSTKSGSCMVDKLGPVLTGTAGFTVDPNDPDGPDRAGSTLVWIEDVTVPRVPQFLAPIVARLGAAGFSLGMRSLARQMGKR